MGGGVAHHLERLRIFFGDQFEAGIFAEGGAQVDHARRGSILGRVHCGFVGMGLPGLAVRSRGLRGVQGGEARNDRRRGQARGDRVGDVEGRGAGRDFFDGAVGQMNGNRICAHAQNESCLLKR